MSGIHEHVEEHQDEPASAKNLRVEAMRLILERIEKEGRLVPAAQLETLARAYAYLAGAKPGTMPN